MGQYFIQFAANALSSSKNQSDPAVSHTSPSDSLCLTDQTIVATYTNITSTETAEEAAPQPPGPVNEFDQYGILNAYLNVSLSPA